MSQAMEIRSERFYTNEHEWAQPVDTRVRVGITAFAVEQLGDITLLDLTVSVGDRLEVKQTFGTVESVRTLSDLFAPVGGTVLAIHTEILDHPEWLNEDPWDKGWLVELHPDRPLGAESSLLDNQAYAELLQAADH